MVGDGINDSAVLAQADLGIAMGQGSDIAIDVEKVTILSSDLTKIAAAAMALSSVSVVANSLQLSTKRLGTKAVHKINTEFITKKQTAMKKEYRIEGMMCNHCRMHVEKALNGIEGLRAVVTLDPPAATVEFTGREPELAELQRVLGEDYKITER